MALCWFRFCKSAVPYKTDQVARTGIMTKGQESLRLMTFTHTSLRHEPSVRTTASILKQMTKNQKNAIFSPCVTDPGDGACSFLFHKNISRSELPVWSLKRRADRGALRVSPHLGQDFCTPCNIRSFFKQRSRMTKLFGVSDETFLPCKVAYLGTTDPARSDGKRASVFSFCRFFIDVASVDSLQGSMSDFV